MRSRSAVTEQFGERAVGAADDGKATGVAADVGISASAEPSALRTIVAASRATTDRKTCRIKTCRNKTCRIKTCRIIESRRR
jgi:hypothetical protein